MNIEQARKAAQKIKGEIASGKDPYEEKHKLSKDKTFGEAFQMYMDRHIQIENKLNTKKISNHALKKYFHYGLIGNSL